MTIKELAELVNDEIAAGNAEREVKVWLPGSKISLVSRGTMIAQGDLLMIEGNVDQIGAFYHIVLKPRRT